MDANTLLMLLQLQQATQNTEAEQSSVMSPVVNKMGRVAGQEITGILQTILQGIDPRTSELALAGGASPQDLAAINAAALLGVARPTSVGGREPLLAPTADQVTLYRGAKTPEAGKNFGWWWTTDRDYAAAHAGENGTVYQVTAPKSAVENQSIPGEDHIHLIYPGVHFNPEDVTTASGGQ